MKKRFGGANHFPIHEIMCLRYRCVRKAGRKGPGSTQRRGQLVVVVRRAFVGVTVERHLDGFMVIVDVDVVGVLVESEG